MFDLHCHCLFSDGELLPSELVRRVEVLGYRVIAITDHVDASNVDLVLPRLVEVAEVINGYSATKLLPGVELTHVHPTLIPSLARKARDLGARVVVCHGETIVEPVVPGTNRVALEADIDILAHPGLVTEDEVRLATENGIMLELSGRKGHCLTNGHVARLALEWGAQLVVNSDGHAPGDFMTAERARYVAEGAGLTREEVESLFNGVWSWLKMRVDGLGGEI